MSLRGKAALMKRYVANFLDLFISDDELFHDVLPLAGTSEYSLYLARDESHAYFIVSI